MRHATKVERARPAWWTLVLGCLLGAVLVTQGACDETPSGDVTLQSITVVAPGMPGANSTLVIKGATVQLLAEGAYSDGSRKDLTDQAKWTSSDQAVVSVDAIGSVSALGKGEATVTAELSGVSGSLRFQVSDNAATSIEIAPANPTVVAGTAVSFQATALFPDGTQKDVTTAVSWSSADPAVATIDKSGRATTLAPGTTAIQAMYNNLSAQTTLTVNPGSLVSIAINPANPSIARGTTVTFTATGAYSDGSTQDISGQVTWASADTNVATFANSGSGVARGVNAGTSAISATLGMVKGNTTLTVKNVALSGLAVTPANPTLIIGTTRQFTATGTFADGSTQDVTDSATWASGNNTFVTVSNMAGSVGVATARARGMTTISATFSGRTAMTNVNIVAATLLSIAITPANARIARRATQQFTATGSYSNGATQDLTTQVTWASSNAGVAPISNANGSKGVAFGLSTGMTTISATFGGVTGSTPLTVFALTLSSITITPANATISVGATQQYTATGVFNDGSMQNLTNQVNWYSTTTGVATISNGGGGGGGGSRGLATGVAAGATTIIATMNGVAGTTNLTVK